jgi:hypothetical protein
MASLGLLFCTPSPKAVAIADVVGCISIENGPSPRLIQIARAGEIGQSASLNQSWPPARGGPPHEMKLVNSSEQYCLLDDMEN